MNLSNERLKMKKKQIYFSSFLLGKVKTMYIVRGFCCRKIAPEKIGPWKFAPTNIVPGELSSIECDQHWDSTLSKKPIDV